MFRRSLNALAVVLSLSATPALALPVYSDLYFLGASALDTGNWIADTSMQSYSGYASFAPLASDGYWQGRWQSGPAWSDYFAAALGHDATASMLGGNNYAYGVGWLGPLAGDPAAPAGSLASLEQLWFPTQVANVLADNHNVLDPQALFVISIGGNDSSVLYGRADQGTERGQLLVAQIELLRAAGASNFLISTLAGTGLYSTEFNAALFAGLTPLSDAGVSISYLDSAAFTAAVFTPPFAQLAALGFTANPPGEACIANAGVPGNAACTAAAIEQTSQGNPYFGSTHFSFDGIHLDTKILQLQADFALAALPPTPVSEPGTLALLLAGLAGLGLMRRRIA